MKLTVHNLGKRYGYRPIFQSVSFELTRSDVLAVTGSNGSGKSTLLKLLANVTERSEGEVRWELDGTQIREGALNPHLGFVAPYLQLYTEFTAWEHAELVQDLLGIPFRKERAEELFRHFNLYHRRYDILSTFSSGMLQRVKFICAMLHSPQFLFLDEPSTNLDEAGIAAVRNLVREESPDRITIIATNDADDLTICNRRYSFEEVLGLEF